MKNLTLFLSALIVSALVISGCEQENSFSDPVSVQKPADGLAAIYNNSSLSRLNNETLAELSRVRAATAKYQNMDKAIEDGYVDANLFVPHMGWHFLNEGLLDGEFNIEQPELLVYAPWPNGKLHLVAVEYAVPHALYPDPPEGFTGTQDEWHLEPPPFDLWTLHAWVWYNNPDGIFEPFNQRVD